MWEIDNATGYGSERAWMRDENGAFLWLVALRANFNIGRDGQLREAEEQPDPPLTPLFRGDPATTGLIIDTDLLARKPGTDVILDAVAYAPGGRRFNLVETEMRLGPLTKRILVHGPRIFTRGMLGLAMSPALPFETWPVHYEWAFGGSDFSDTDPARWRMDERNPIGKGVAASNAELIDRPAPMIEYPGRSLSVAGPAGYGPIPQAWLPRRPRAGTYDAAWEANRKPLLPTDYDPAFAMSAPDDQRLPRHLEGGEPVLLTNLSPDGWLRFDLPRLNVSFETVIRGRSVAHEGKLTTIFITPHERKVSLTWQAALTVDAHETEYVDHTLIEAERLT